ncbi:ATP-grasp domain-containing protein [Aeromonas allosaccharophila]|uniref:ATP-grasp domain-containing protein n=1 Tax=Aeromonas allosaccharophila TaxID=656 RepID=UPI003D1B9BE2
MRKVAIIGSGEFQLPLINMAREQGIQTHVFSWGGNESAGDYFYQISITEKESILEQCRLIGVDGICSIGSDLANITVNYVANKLGLVGNSIECTSNTTNKYLMRQHLKKNNIPVPPFHYLKQHEAFIPNSYPVIVKPADRSGSRGITLVESKEDITSAVKLAFEESFSKEVLIESFVNGREFSVESVSYNGEHKILQITEKFTTGAPGFIEKGHTCPARITKHERCLIFDVAYKTLDAVNLMYGAAHTELKINDDGDVFVIEIGSRMGGDYIGSDLVFYSTGFNFTKAVLAIAMGDDFKEIDFISKDITPKTSIVKFIFGEQDLTRCRNVVRQSIGTVIHSDFEKSIFSNGYEIMSSVDRLGHILLVTNIDEQDSMLEMLGF